MIKLIRHEKYNRHTHEILNSFDDDTTKAIAHHIKCIWYDAHFYVDFDDRQLIIVFVEYLIKNTSE